MMAVTSSLDDDMGHLAREVILGTSEQDLGCCVFISGAPYCINRLPSVWNEHICHQIDVSQQIMLKEILTHF